MASLAQISDFSKVAVIAVMLSGSLGCAAAPTAENVSSTPTPPNILWIMAEDMGPELGVYGEPEVRTPNLDELARGGMVFDKAFTTAPICSISRSALATGMYATSIGAHQHRTRKEEKKPLPEGVKLLTDRFRDAGYYTALITEVEKPGGADDWFKGKAKTDWNFLHNKMPYDGHDMANLKANQPFFAHVQFPETHRGKDWDKAASVIDHAADPNKVDLPPYYPDHPLARQDWADYLNAVMAFDRKAGVVLRRLREEGLAKNTIVIMLGDHGRAMVRGKQWLFDSGLHVPLIVYVPEGLKLPDGYKPGSRSDQLVSGIDITATTLNLAGIDPGLVMQGRPFLGNNRYLRQFVFAARDRADETKEYMRTVRGERFRYIRNYYPERPYTQFNAYKEIQYPVLRLMHRMYRDSTLGPIPSLFMAASKPSEELYDTIKDPHNVNNLAGDTTYAGTLDKMRTLLTTWEIETNDQGRHAEPPEIATAIAKKAMRRWQPTIDKIIKDEGPWLDGQSSEKGDSK